MDTTPLVVVGLDGSPGSMAAMDLACEEATLRQAHLEVIWAWRDLDRPSPFWEVGFDPNEIQLWAQRRLEEIVARSPAARDLRVVARAVNDAPATALIEAASRAALLVVGARGRGGFLGLRLGSVSQKVLGPAPCPVLVAREGDSTDQSGGQGTIVVGVDGSEPSRRALRWALTEASLRSAPLFAVHGWSVPPVLTGTLPSAYPPADVFEKGARLLVDAELDRAGREAPEVVVDGRSVCASGAAALIDASAGASMLVVGSRGRGRMTGLILGSVSHQVANHAHCPVAVVPVS